MKLYPEEIANASDAARMIGVARGTRVYLRTDVGDFDGTRSVTIPKGYPGRVSEFIVSSEGYWKVAVAVLPSPGQTLFFSLLRDFAAVWTTDKPQVSEPESRYARLLNDRGRTLFAK
jgi:hypothetical protein